MSRATHVSETPATAWLRKQGVAFDEHAYEYVEHGGTRVSSQSLGVPEHQVVKTLVMQDEQGKALIVLMHGDRKVSTKSLAARSTASASSRARRRRRSDTRATRSGAPRRSACASRRRSSSSARCSDSIASTSTAAGAASWSASRRRCSLGRWARSRSTARWKPEEGVVSMAASITAIAGAYLLGSVSFAVVMSRLFASPIREAMVRATPARPTCCARAARRRPRLRCSVTGQGRGGRVAGARFRAAVRRR